MKYSLGNSSPSNSLLADTKLLMKQPKPFEEKVEDITTNRSIENAAEEERRASIWTAVRKEPRVVFWCLFFSFSAIGWGFDAQVNGAMISVPQFRATFGYIYQGEPVLPASWQSAFNSISSVGQFIGGFLCSWVADRIGRRWGLLVGLAFVTGGIFGEVFASTRPAFLGGKLVLGLGLGFYLTLSPLYASELAPVSLRGIVTSGTNLGICIGQLLSNAAIKGFGSRTDNWAFRGPFALQWVFVVVLLCGLPWAPESPWYLVRKGNTQMAERALQTLYCSHVDISPKLAVLVKTVQDDLEETSTVHGIECFQTTNSIRTAISVGVFACQHLSGIVFVLGFSTYFFELAGININHAFDLGVGVTAIGLVGCIISWSVINSWGRRKLFISGMIGMTCVLLLMGLLDVVSTGAAKWVQASCTVIYAFIYQVTIGPLAFAILGETSSPTLRARTIGLATACQAVFGTLMNIVVPYMVNPDAANLKGKVGFVFGGACALATVWSYFFIPELKGRTFADIDLMFQRKVKPRRMGSYSIENESRI